LKSGTASLALMTCLVAGLVACGTSKPPQMTATAATGTGRPATGTVVGALVRVGGPAPGSAVPLTGQVIAVSSRGARFAIAAGARGRYRLSLPPGAYRLTGRSPIVHVNGAQMRCAAAHPVQVTAGETASDVDVICSVR
jgi:hypothetical protein